MLKWNVGMKIGTGFGLALAILVAIGAVSYRSTTELIVATDWRKHTQEVLETIDDVLSTMKDAETGQRGYIITGDERYLEPFRAAEATINQKVKALRDLTRDNVNQQRRLDILEPLIDGKDGKFA